MYLDEPLSKVLTVALKLIYTETENLNIRDSTIVLLKHFGWFKAIKMSLAQ